MKKIKTNSKCSCSILVCIVHVSSRLEYIHVHAVLILIGLEGRSLTMKENALKGQRSFPDPHNINCQVWSFSWKNRPLTGRMSSRAMVRVLQREFCAACSSALGFPSQVVCELFGAISTLKCFFANTSTVSEDNTLESAAPVEKKLIWVVVLLLLLLFIDVLTIGGKMYSYW